MKENTIHQSRSTERRGTPEHISKLLLRTLERYTQMTGDERYMRLSERVHRLASQNSRQQETMGRYQKNGSNE